MLKLINIDINEFKTTVYPSYVELFPDSERKPYKLLASSYAKGMLKIIKIVENDIFIGFIITNSVKGNGCLQVDYFAILPKYQGKSYGTKAITLLKQISKEYYGIFIEVEKAGLGITEGENKLRERRIQFYERLGFIKLHFDLNLFNVIFSPYIIYTSKNIQDESKVKEDIIQLYIAVMGKERFEKYCKLLD